MTTESLQACQATAGAALSDSECWKEDDHDLKKHAAFNHFRSRNARGRRCWYADDLEMTMSQTL